MIVYFGLRHFYVKHTTTDLPNDAIILTYQKRIWDYTPHLKTAGVNCGQSLIRIEKRLPNVTIIPINIWDYSLHNKDILAFCHQWTHQVETEYPHAWYGKIPDHLWNTKFGQSFLDHLATLNLSGIWGAAPSKILAKWVAHSQPNSILTANQTEQFLANLPINRLQIPEKTQLHKLGIYTLGDFKAIPIPQLTSQFGQRAKEILQLAQGIDATPFQNTYTKDIAWEINFLTDPTIETMIAQPKLQHFLEQGVQELSQQLETTTQLTRQVQLWYYDETNKEYLTKTFNQATKDPQILMCVLTNILPKHPISQLGLKATQLEKHTPKQLDIFCQNPTTNQLDSLKTRLADKLLDLTLSRREKVLELWESSYL